MKKINKMWKSVKGTLFKGGSVQLIKLAEIIKFICRFVKIKLAYVV